MHPLRFKTSFFLFFSFFSFFCGRSESFLYFMMIHLIKKFVNIFLLNKKVCFLIKNKLKINKNKFIFIFNCFRLVFLLYIIYYFYYYIYSSRGAKKLWISSLIPCKIRFLPVEKNVDNFVDNFLNKELLFFYLSTR